MWNPPSPRQSTPACASNKVTRSARETADVSVEASALDDWVTSGGRPFRWWCIPADWRNAPAEVRLFDEQEDRTQ